VGVFTTSGRTSGPSGTVLSLDLGLRPKATDRGQTAHLARWRIVCRPPSRPSSTPTRRSRAGGETLLTPVDLPDPIPVSTKASPPRPPASAHQPQMGLSSWSPSVVSPGSVSPTTALYLCQYLCRSKYHNRDPGHTQLTRPVVYQLHRTPVNVRAPAHWGGPLRLEWVLFSASGQLSDTFLAT